MRNFLALAFILLLTAKFSAQVGINTNGNAPDPSSMLDITSEDKGILIPRLNSEQRDNIGLPAEGLLIYNTFTRCFESFVNGVWSKISCPSPCSNTSGAITGNASMCQGGSSSYSVVMDNAASCMWSYTGNGATIQNNGPFSVTVIFSEFATSGMLVAMGTTSCSQGSGVFSAHFPIVISDLPQAAGFISGDDQVCAGTGGLTYSVEPVAGAEGYNWQLPPGATIVSGEGTASITVNFSNQSGQITVTPVNACGNGQSSSSFITVENGVPSTPGSINGSFLANINSAGTYSISPLSGSPVYTWEITPSNASLSGQGDASVSVNFPETAGTFELCVTAENGCGSSSSSCINVLTYVSKQTFVYTGSNQTFNVPSGVSSVYVKLWGAGGGGAINYSGGSGAYVGGFLDVSPGAPLTIIVGGGGIKATSNSAPAGGFGGGGDGGASNNVNNFRAGSGGGRSAIRILPGQDAVTAGGGGGCGPSNDGGAAGGGGGDPNGRNGYERSEINPGTAGAGKGATTSAGGAGTTASGAANSTAGSAYQGSAGGTSGYGGGGGGGGYYGGSGGAGNPGFSGNAFGPIGGGGGGSSYTANLTSPVNLAGLDGNITANVPAPNNSDPDYQPEVGFGQYSNTLGGGGNGLVVIYW